MELINQTIDNLKTGDCERKISKKIQIILKRNPNLMLYQKLQTFCRKV